MSSNYTFWDLIKEHRIEIPIIQRDYAQGRKNTQSTEIRKNFTQQIKEVLDNKQATLHLNFVYGKLNGKQNAVKLAENKEAVKSMLEAVRTYSRNLELDILCEVKEPQAIRNGNFQSSFVPLDGQQRLTTLFLLHWYLMPQSEENSTILKKFSYRIRPTSKDFCEALIENKVELTQLKGATISMKIKNEASWFYDYWKNDPTVRGMLRMLDQIDETFGGENQEVYWSRLVNDRAITFEFLDLDNLKLTDELYVRMNARGVALTPFENFKAWLIEYLQENQIQVAKFGQKNWVELMDTTWTDLFWANKDDDNMLIDEEVMRYFRNMMQIFLVQQDNFNPEADNKRDTPEKIKNAQKQRDTAALLATQIDKETNEYKYIPNSFYLEHNLLTIENLNELFSSIQNLSKQSFDMAKLDQKIQAEDRSISLIGKDRGSIFRRFIDKETSYSDKVLFYALHVFLQKTSQSNGELETDALRSWLRVIRNLVENTTIDSVPLFKRSISTIKSLEDQTYHIYEYLNEDKVTLVGFDGYQRAEEILKAKYILMDQSWENVFLKYENHPYFKGQIKFLIELAELEVTPMSIVVFEKYAEKMAAIFDLKLDKPNTTKFERALLTENVDNSNTGYLFGVNSNQSFGTMNDAKTSWKNKVFRSPERLKAIKSLLDKIGVNNIEADMQKICDSYDMPGWKCQVVHTPEAVTACGQRMIRYWGENNIRLLGSSATSHYHSELFSYCLDQKIRKLLHSKNLDISPFRIGNYEYVRSASHHAYARLEANINSSKYELHLHFDHNNLLPGDTFMPFPYEIAFINTDKMKREKQYYPPVIREALERNGFIWKDNQDVQGYWISASTDEEILTKLNVLTNELSQVECEPELIK
ncbi:GmrSD restriction endonuclease domain-containing protein [Mangrovibacterium diazotrophicum]|uniref:Uncharacterized protein DUF262 n=1 Tax=Mangrovibacterium diazotrophicum TaxID=1261403 RepID=A0A419W3K5_9BACT|nr:DUF262 domain-containing protein [Mangrovibacterium diazotrophicum]RKD90033.1 uncharacterized protein DUF262 [Mangrovibacterium diazotrophicum]